MKPEPDAWRALQTHAAAQLGRGFADRALRAARGPSAFAWQQLFARGAAEVRPGFAERVLRAAWPSVELPSLRSHVALSLATAACCLAAVLFVHDRQIRDADERNLADWQRIVLEAERLDTDV